MTNPNSSQNLMCIRCGESFVPNNAQDVLCPNCASLVERSQDAEQGVMTAAEPGIMTQWPDEDGDLASPLISATASGQPQAASTEADVPAIWKVGDVILDLYEVKNIFESGGMGLVYQVYHRNWKVDLVAKSPRPDFFKTDAQRENFIAEADTWIKLGLHPHIVSCYYVRTLGGIPRLFAEYVGGGNLHDWVKDRRLYEGGPDTALARMLDVAIQFAWGLDYAHAQGLVHQDVKPGNVMMTPDGIAQVTDFGLAKVRAAAEDVSPTDPSISALVSVGGYTPAYCSPEQARRDGLSHKTDLWSWGVSLLEMFLGGMTWKTGQAAEAVLDSYLQQGPGDPAIPPMPTDLVDLLRRCFREDADERPKSMAEIANELKAIYQQAAGTPCPREEPKPAEALADSLNNRAASMLDIGKPDEANKLWDQALAVDPQHLETTYNWGVQRWRRGEMTDDALVQQLEGARSTVPYRWDGPYLLGLVHLERADVEAALPLLEAAVEMAPDEAELQGALALARSGDITAARCLRVMEGHRFSVNSVALSGDGRLALSGSNDNTLRLWDLANGSCLRVLEGHSASVNSVAFSSDGHLALSGSSDLTLRLWNVGSGECLRVLEGHTYYVNSVALSADSRLAVSGSGSTMLNKDATVRLWDLAGGRCLSVLEGHKFSVQSVALSADARLAISGSYDNTLRLWEVETGNCLGVLVGHTDDIQSVALSADGRLALSGSSDKTVRLWDVASGRCLRVLRGHTDSIRSVALSADGRLGLSGSGDSSLSGSSDDHSLRLWDVANGRCLRVLKGHTYSVNSVALSGDGCLVLSGSGDHLLMGRDDRTLRLWELPSSWPQLASSTRLTRRQSYADLSQAAAEAEMLLVGSRAALAAGEFAAALQLARQARGVAGYERAPRCLQVWAGLYAACVKVGLRPAWPASVLEGHTSWVKSLALSLDGLLALSGSGDNTLRLWNLERGECLLILEGHTHNVTSVALSADSRLALSGSLDNTLRLWELESGRCLHILEGHTDWVESVALTVDSRLALSGSRDHTLRLWELESGRCLRVLRGHTDSINSVALSADGRLALSGSNGNTDTLRLWELASGHCLRVLEGHTSLVCSVALSADGRLALSGSFDETLRLWDVASGRCMRVLEGHTNNVNSVALSADGCLALSGSWDKTLRLWELASGQCLRVLEGHTHDVESAALSANGRYALSGSDDETVRLWELDWELQAHDAAGWDDGARPHLENFLTLHSPLAGTLPEGREPSEKEIGLALTRRGKPAWTEEDFQRLLTTLSYVGYGWLRPEGVRRQLEAMARDWQGPPPLLGDTQ